MVKFKILNTSSWVAIFTLGLPFLFLGCHFYSWVAIFILLKDLNSLIILIILTKLTFRLPSHVPKKFCCTVGYPPSKSKFCCTVGYPPNKLKLCCTVGYPPIKSNFCCTVGYPPNKSYILNPNTIKFVINFLINH